VATEFHELQHKATVLETQKLTLSDAMELEGLDFEQIDDDHKNENDEIRRTKEANLPPLSWYHANNETNDLDDEPKAKRTKTLTH
jgi:hypothetical protein